MTSGFAVGDISIAGEERVFLSNKLSDKYHFVFEYFVADDKGDCQISTTDMVGSESCIIESYNKGYVRYDAPGFSKTPLY